MAISTHGCQKNFRTIDCVLSIFSLKKASLHFVGVESIVKVMIDPTANLYYLFLAWILPKFVGLNELFQGDGSLIATVHQAMSKTYKEVLLCYMDRK